MEVALLTVTEESEKWACATLAPHVDRVIVLLRRAGLVEGRLDPPDLQTVARSRSTSWVHSAGGNGGYHIATAVPRKPRDRRVEVAPAAKGAVAAYEEARALFEPIYDIWGLGPEQAMRCDEVLWHTYLKHGPSPRTLKLAAAHVERLAHEQVPLSFEELLEEKAEQYTDDSDVSDVKEPLVDWPWSKRPQLECTWGPRFYVRPLAWPSEPPETRFPEVHGKLSLMFCDRCNDVVVPLFRTRKGEFCRECLIETGRPLYGWMHNGELNRELLKYT